MLPHEAGAAEPAPWNAAIERSEIVDLLANTLLAFDDRDYPRFASNFTDDGVFTVVEVGTNKTLVSVASSDIVATFGRMPLPPGDPHHYTSNLTVTFHDENRATLRGYYMTVRNDGPDVPPRPVGMGTYACQVVRQDGKWKFAEYRALRSAGEG